MSAVYKIIRFYERREVPNRVVRRGLTLEEAQAHCNDPETSSRTCTKYHQKRRTRDFGHWFDGYTEEK